MFNDPLNVVAIWIALEDANIENGCLWFLPGSNSSEFFFLHTCLQQIRQCLEMPQQRYIRNPNEKEFNEGKKLILTGEEEKFDDNAFVPVEVKAGRIIEYYCIVYVLENFLFSGDAVIIHGQVVHKSEQSMKYRIESISD
jgi:ectoine hydroxylase-related dioxygenase (phytanoyl-CoA dioxygenase family)